MFDLIISMHMYYYDTCLKKYKWWGNLVTFLHFGGSPFLLFWYWFALCVSIIFALHITFAHLAHVYRSRYHKLAASKQIDVG
jgi:hypothetical protein